MGQLALPLPATWGGRRAGAGRKRNGPRPRVPHDVRPWHDEAHPSHVTLRARAGLPSLRGPAVFSALCGAIRRAKAGGGLRVCHFSIQSNHIHLIVEAKDRKALARAMQSLVIRLAFAVNRTLARRGPVWADRYHRHDLTTPTEVAHAVRYVLENVRKHQPGFHGVDPCSSAFGRAREAVAAPRTWLLRVGWRTRGQHSATRIAWHREVSLNMNRADRES